MDTIMGRLLSPLNFLRTMFDRRVDLAATRAEVRNVRGHSSAAFSAAERRPSSLEIVTLDERLAAAARKEGLVLIEVPSGE